MRRTSGGRLAGFVFPLLVVAALAASEISLAPDTPPAEVGEFPLEVEGEVWTSDPIEVDATAIGLSWHGEDPSRAAVRVSEDGESWGEWTDIHDPDDHGPDPESPEAAHAHDDISEAVYVGEARWLQFRIEGSPDDVEVTYVDTTGRSRSLGEKLTAFLERIEFGGEAAVASPDQPPVMPRSAWGGEECVAANPDYRVRYIDRVEVMFVHHTVHSASANSYDPEDVPALLYAICSFHVSANGWNDIAYNVLIDKYGTVWEGRGGGLDQPILGGHTGGFNSYSTGVAFIGDYRSTSIELAAQQAFVDYATWKLDVHHVDPLSMVSLESLGSTRWEEGTMVALRAVSGHKDVSTTSCPGDGVFALLDGWRQQIEAGGGAKIYGGWPLTDPIPGSRSEGYTATPFAFRLTEPMSWTLTVTAPDGTEVLRQTGSGTEASIPWDGTYLGSPLPYGDYRVRVEAVPASGAPAPRPADFSFTLGDFLPPFSDDEGSPHEADITTIFEAGITTGCDSERYCPRADLERWQMALFLTRLQTASGLSLPAGADQGFTDVGWLSPGALQAVNQLAEMGVTKGTGEGTFDPGGRVSRWQMALFLLRWLESAGVVLPEPVPQGFEDIGDLPPETQAAIEAIAQVGITRGTEPGLFDPHGLVTREQMASFLARAMAIVAGPASSTDS